MSNNNPKQNPTSGVNGTPSGGRLLDRYTVSHQSDQQDKSPYYKSSAPSISLPKGGGALKGIDEKFTVNAVNGTAAIDVPLPVTPGRSGFTPKLSLGYNSGSGNGMFGLGWGLSLPAIQRRTDKQLPMYDDSEDSDVFVLAGAEDLQPALKEDGDRDEYISSDTYYLVRRYIPRIEGLFARIELITKMNTAGSWWRVTTKDNITTYYGLTDEGRISDPEDGSRIFKWLPQISYDHKGNVQQYCYVNEDSSNVKGIAERNRLNGLAPFTNTYLKRVKYCNQAPYVVDSDEVYEPSIPLDESASPDYDPAYLMELVFDFGEHDAIAPTPEPASGITWPCRIDPFSDFHAGFEIRTYRRCMRVLMFHYFSELTGGDTLSPVLVYSLDMAYANADAASAPGTYAEADLINSITHTGYQSYTSGDALLYHKKSLPAMTMDYQPLQWDHTLYNVSKEDAENAPQGLTGPYQWIDLWGEGLPGILTEQAGGWFYKQNLGDGHFAPSMSIAPKPSVAGLGSSLQWQDLDADGRRQLVGHAPGLSGYFELDDAQDWLPFRAFKERVNVDWDSPYTRVLDLNGDGRPDILLTEERAWRWYENRGTEGYALGGYGPVTYDEEKGPRILLNDMVQVIFLADMNGDGMTDIVRIQNGEVCYWPNMGFGRFGARVAMANAPVFDLPDMFNPMYITLADISGTGAADLIYLGGNKCTAWVNLAGNAWSTPTVINPLPGTDQYSKIAVMDFLGNGTPCIVWSSPLPQHAWAPMRYIDLMGGNKPYLMNSYSNNMGKTTTLTYKQSTDYYLEDMAAGMPWATRLPFPVHCVSTVTTADSVSETSYTQTYAYHHGYYDHPEREFRGFGRVDVIDTDMAVAYDPGSTPVEDDLDQAPVLTKTWYHTGAWMQEGTLLSAFATEYYSTGWSSLPNEPDLSANSDMSAQEIREAYRALKGQAIRQEVYALDGTELQGVPYMVSANSFAVNMLQPVGDNLYACFYSYKQQGVQWHAERNTDDPRVLHDLTISIDEYGNVLEAAQVSYPRSVDNATGIANIDNVQQAMLVSYTVNAYTNDASDTGTDDVDNYFLRLPYQVSAYELANLDVPAGLWSVTDIQTAYSDATDMDFTGDPTVDPGTVYRRLLSCTRTTFLGNDASTILDLGTVAALGLVYQHYQLAATGDMLTDSNYYDSNVTEDMLEEGAYLLEDNITEFGITGTGNYWLPSGTMQYSNSLSSPIDVADTFYLPFGFTDPWGNETKLDYWGSYYLLPVCEKDALHNRTIINTYDWRCLQPVSITDLNDNISTILFDELCMPVAMALEGKGSEEDDISDVDPTNSMDITYQSDFWTDPEGNAANLLKGATWRCVYDLTASPVCVAMIAREKHDAISYTSPMQIRLTYTDGLGRIAMHKLQATDDPTSPTEARWIGSGKTVYNNKGKAVMQYEPYYSTTPAYDTAEQAAMEGVTPRMHYDPLGRVVRTDLPDGSYTMTEFDAWQQVVYDNNDTVQLVIDGTTVNSDWYTAWSTGTTEQQDAATKALAHANTPTIMQFDTLARPFYTRQYLSASDPSNVAGTDYYDTYVTLDILGNRLVVVDARNSATLVYTSLQYSYNMLKAVVSQQSADSGDQLLFSDVAGQPLYAWDADMRQFHYEYDELRRPVEKDVTPSGGSNKVLELMVYGEDQTDDTTYNLRGKLYMQYDGAGTQTIPSYDFKGNPLTTIRQYVSDYTHHPDWTDIGSVDMETDTYETDMAYDALNRPVTITTPDDGDTNYTYDKAGLLCSVDIDNVGTGVNLTTDIINYIGYNARGQRTKVQYENGASTFYHYDPYTFRVIKIKTIRSSDSKVLQDLKYWYDPIGNITIQDDDAQEDAYFSNTVVSPDNNYTYDPLYRLIQADGRENGTDYSAPNYNDSNSAGQPLPNDASAMRNYSQYYTYDPAGNMTEMQHVVSGGGWTRDFTISGSSNQLKQNTIGSNRAITESYTYDARGNMIFGLNHLSNSTSPADDNMIYNEENRLEQVAVTATITAYYQYDAGGQRVRKVKTDSSSGGLTHTRKYIGQWELYDKIDNGTNLVLLERETLQIMDDKSRIALIDTPTIVPGGSTEGQVQRYQFSNHLGSCALELDDSACVISYEEYYPFGSTSFQAITSAIEVSLKRYRYTGKERDEETGFYYHGARYYVPWIARWVAVDPLAHKRSFESPYSAMRNNPILNIDPDGQSWEPVGKDGKAVQLSDKANITGYRWVGYNKDDKGNMIARANTVETAYTFGEKGMTTLSSEGHTEHRNWQAYSEISTGDQQADKNIASLDPRVQDQMKSVVLMGRLRYGIDIRGGQEGGFRTYDEQDKIFARGASNAKGGQSNHNFALAMDVAIYENGKYLSKGSEWQYKTYGDIAKKRGLMWGGDWKTFFDPAHIEYKHNLTMKQLRALPKDANGYLIKLP